jgi:uncharacterized protein YukE
LPGGARRRRGQDRLRGVSLLPDPAELTAVADRIAGHAAAARERAIRLEHAVAATEWRGFAAGAFFAEAQMATSALRSAAARLDTAADALRRHAERVGALIAHVVRLGQDGLELLGDTFRHPDEVLPDAARLAGDAVDLVGDGASAVRGAVGDVVGVVGVVRDLGLW